MRMPTSRTDAERGFTLLEFLAALAILALAAGAVLQMSQGSLETAGVRSFLIEAEAIMRLARTAAIETRSDQEVTIDTSARRLIYVAEGRELDVPRGLSLDGVLARLGDAEDHTFRIRFFPSGGSTGASLPFRFRGLIYELRVNWLTGHADVRRG